MPITPEQRAILLKSKNFREQAGIDPKSQETLSKNVNVDDIRARLMGIGAPKIAPSVAPSVAPVQDVSISDQAPVKKQSFLNKIGSAVISSEKGFADTIGTALASLSKDYTKALESKSAADDMANKLAIQIKKMEKDGKDVGDAKKRYQALTGINLDDGLQATQDYSATGILGEAAGKNAKQIFGEGLGVATDIIGAGSVGRAAKGVKAISTVKEGVKAGAKVGATFGGVSGISEGMQANKDLKGIIGSGVAGATTGAALGAITGGVAGKIASKKANKVYKPLDLSTEELAKVQKKRLKYLSKQGMEMTPTEGGVLKSKKYKMTEQVKELSKEFKNVLVGKNAEENLTLAQKAGKALDKTSDDVIAANNKIINEKTLRSQLKKAIEGIKGDTTFTTLSKTQKTNLRDSVIDDFMSYVKKGDLEGINNARKAWSGANRGADKTMSKANKVMHDALQDLIQKSLPEADRAVYQANKVKMAKLFDVREILRAKKAATIGKSAIKSVKKGIGAVTSAAALGGAVGYGLSKVSK